MTGISSLELVHSLELLFEVSRPEEGPGGSSRRKALEAPGEGSAGCRLILSLL